MRDGRIEVRLGLPLRLRAAAAVLIWDAFGGQIAPITGRRAGIALVRRALRRHAVLAALDGQGRLLGLTGLRGPDGGILAAPSGRLSGWRLPGRHTADLVLDALVVAPNARGRGVARALVEAALAEARRRGHPGLCAEVRRRNRAAHRMFRAAGMERAGFTGVFRDVVLRRGV